MSQRNLRRAAVGLVSGFVAGVVMLWLGIDWKDAAFGEQLFGSTSAMQVWKGVNGPALWLADLWTYKAGLPPQNEAAWVVTPAIMILLQWALIGILAGAWWAFRPCRKSGGTIKPDEQEASPGTEHGNK